MSAHDASASDADWGTVPDGSDDGRGRDELPAFDYRYLIDEAVEPVEVTVFPADPKDPVTEWVSMDVEHTVPLEEVR
jgi:hypothetical protein